MADFSLIHERRKSQCPETLCVENGLSFSGLALKSLLISEMGKANRRFKNGRLTHWCLYVVTGSPAVVRGPYEGSAILPGNPGLPRAACLWEVVMVVGSSGRVFWEERFMVKRH